MKIQITITTFLACASLLFSCGDSEAAETPEVPVAPIAPMAPAASIPTVPSPESMTLGNVRNLRVLEGIYLAGQPQESDVPLLKAEGIKTVIDLRLPTEVRGYDEPKAIEEAGMTYVSVPFNSADELNDEVFDKIRALLSDEANHPVMVHCGSANRVGAVWLPFRVLDQDQGQEDALAEARTVGLRNPAMEKAALDYIERVDRDRKD